MSNANLETLIEVLKKNPTNPLIFYKDDTAIQPGYHVTEVKQAKIDSLDCGNGIDKWTEVIVQLFDGVQHSKQDYMIAQKFMGIINAALNSGIRENSAELYFEFSHQNGPLQRLRAVSVENTGAEIMVTLQGESAGCKPFLRARASIDENSSDSVCCGSATVNSGNSVCCGGTEDQNHGGSCCA